VLRPAPGKKQAKIFDYVDVHVGVLKSAAAARQAVYGNSKKIIYHDSLKDIHMDEQDIQDIDFRSVFFIILYILSIHVNI
jgi:hypothetical protein